MLAFALGMTVMWHFQKMVIDHLVASAPEAEKKLSVYLLNIADLGAAGQLTFQGQPLGKPDMPNSVRESVKTLLPAAALGTRLSDFQAPASGWVTQPPTLPLAASAELLDNAYRNTITPPIALGLSSFGNSDVEDNKVPRHFLAPHQQGYSSLSSGVNGASMTKP